MGKSSNFQRRLVSFCTRHKLNASQFAKFVGFPARTVQNWMSGSTRCPKPENQAKVKQAMIDFERLNSHEELNNMIHLTESTIPVKIKFGNIVITIDVLKGEAHV